MLWAVSRLRAGERLTAGRLAERFEVDVRTAYRDFDFLRDRLDAPIAFDARRRTYFLTDASYNLPPLTLTQGELLGLFFAERVVRQYRGTPYEAALQAALRKLQLALPDEIQVDANPLEGFLSLDLGPIVAPQPEIFRRVVEALVNRRQLRMRYKSLSRGRTDERTVEPYRVYNLQGLWYLAALDHKRSAVRDFALHRIESAAVLDETYVIDPRFDFERYMADSFGIEKGARPVNVAIRFGPRQARWIRERHWHPTAKIQERFDGGCVLRMKVAGLAEVKRWVMQFGAEAEVLSPKALRREVAADLRAAWRQYANHGHVQGRR
jgi:predicted DNA-binding transcriptional regulator YafY